MPSISGGGLAAERASMSVFRRAFKLALEDRPVSDSPAIDAVQPGAANLRDGIEAHIATLPTSDPLARAWADITEYQRTHADTAALIAAFGVTDTWTDQLFRDAMTIEAGG